MELHRNGMVWQSLKLKRMVKVSALLIMLSWVKKNPRSMTLADNGLLIVAAVDGNSLSFFNLDFATGKLTKAKEDLQSSPHPEFVGIFDLAVGCNRKTSTVLV